MRAARLLRDRSAQYLLYSSVIFSTVLSHVCCQQSQENRTNTSLLAPDSLRRDDVRQISSNVKRSVAEIPQPACSSIAAGFLLSDATDLRLNMSDPLDRNISQILDRDGPDMRPSRDYKDFKDITLDVSKRAWFLLHEHVSVAVRERVDLAWPAIEGLLKEARVSRNCTRSVRVLLDGAKNMDSWAIRLLNSWGHFPMSGIYEGTYGSVGSFHTCLDIEKNEYIDHAHYCSVTFRPLMPSQKDYEIIVRQEPRELRRMFEQSRFDQGIRTTGPGRVDYQRSSADAFTDILEHAQYHHFLHYKWGTCWPIQCSPFDVRRVAKTFGRKSILLNGPVKCYSKFADDYEEPDSVEDEVGGAGGGTAAVAPRPSNANQSDQATGGRAMGTDAHSGPRRQLVISVWDRNKGIFIWKPHFTRPQMIALAIVVVVTGFIAFMTAIDVCFVRLPPLYQKLILCLKGMPLDGQANAGHGNSFALCPGQKHPTRPGFAMVPSNTTEQGVPPDAFHPAAVVTTSGIAASEDQEELTISEMPAPPGFFMSLVDDCSVITNLGSFFRVSEGQLKNDILCLNGVRCITMVWIIMTHSMMYNDWTAFARTRAIEVSLDSLVSQPIFNGSYLVDTFFLMSGLLSAFTAFKHCQAKRAKFNSFAFIFGRWLRLTPQILFVSLIFIVFPALSYGPHWYPIVGEFSENCVKNWWINVLHLQAFYKQEEMCNFVTWWISIDFFYHFLALAVIWVILAGGHKLGSLSIASIISGAVLWQSWRHYTLGLPPNVLSTIPQTGAMWTTMTLDFFWTPYAHSVPFFFGFYLGYLMALKRKLIVRFLNTRRALIGWTLSVGLFVGQSYSTYWWVTGRADYSQGVSTLFFGACSFVWAGSLCWTIIACQHGYGGFVNRVLSWKVFIVLGKSSYLIYLSHFMVLFVFFGRQNIFLEPSPLNMAYIVLGNITLSTLLGIFLCSAYEIPWLKMHRRLMKYV